MGGRYSIWRYSDATGPDELTLPPGINDVRVSAMNDKGQLVLLTFGANPDYRYTVGGGHDALPAPPNATAGCNSNAISAAGTTIAGSCYLTGGGSYAALWSETSPGSFTVQDLNTRVPAGSGWVLPTVRTMSASGLLIAGEGLRNGQERGYLLDLGSNTIRDVGIVVTGTGRVTPNRINAKGDVAGTAYDGGGNNRAFFYSQVGGVRYLDTVIDPKHGVTLTEAAYINDAGQIVGSYRVGAGSVRIFLLTPIE